MTRTDRLYGLVEELRAVSPRPRSARWLAGRFGVSTRTIERDCSALQQSGVPIWAEPGRTGGYCLDAAHTLPPLGLTATETLAVTVALAALATSPFRDAAASALAKIAAVASDGSAAESAALASRIHLLGPSRSAVAPPVLLDALRDGRVVRLDYTDRNGAATQRDVEPMGFVGKGDDWYLIAWCRLRGALRAFRGDRIIRVEPLLERTPPRSLHVDDLGIVEGSLRTVGPADTSRSETPTARRRGPGR